MRVFLFWGLGLFSTIWFLVRVIPKPSRASYPCMQTAAPLMSAFVMYLLSFTGVWVSLRKLREAFRNRKAVIGFGAFAGLCFFGTLMLVENSTDLLAQAFIPAIFEPKAVSFLPCGGTRRMGPYHPTRINTFRLPHRIIFSPCHTRFSRRKKRKKRRLGHLFFFISIGSMAKGSVDIRKEKGLLSRLIRIILSPMKIVSS